MGIVHIQHILSKFYPRPCPSCSDRHSPGEECPVILEHRSQAPSPGSSHHLMEVLLRGAQTAAGGTCSGEAIRVLLSGLTHWGRVTHICGSKPNIIGSNNGLSSGHRQAIIWTKAGILLIWPLGTNFSEILLGIHTFSFRKMPLKRFSAKRQPCCLGLNVLTLHVLNYFEES